MDFTLNKYTLLLTSLKNAGYTFQTFELFLQNPQEKVIILRHDVDLRAQNSLVTAKIENKLGIRGSYYFRNVKESNNPDIIKQIAELGHEIGYHYETMDTTSRNSKLKTQRSELLLDTAFEEFCENLEYFRTFYPVKTICMHGSPLSKFDNKDIWKKYDYKSLGLIGEPYFDVDFSKVLYLTDTGRRWDGEKVSVRDRVKRDEQGGESSVNVRKHYHSTNDIIKASDEGSLPDQIMITVHPQRWNDSLIHWIKELVMQNIKNIVKGGLIRIRDRSY
ncbi:MAG: hypothetical protein EHM93_20185 [Bacteroidales bacterium]|nr:MAG: hypothetical protein EHM93_20185 [Bacteroidales bacterium]